MKIRDIRKLTGLSQSKFAEKYSIPLPTLQHWERDYTQPPKYFIRLLEKDIAADRPDTMYFKGKNEELYIYSADAKTITDIDGNTVRITDSIKDVKRENIGIYLSDLFDFIKQAQRMFNMDCEEDLRSDIIWIEN